MDKKIYCSYCLNARIYEPTEEELYDPYTDPLTDKNDFSSCTIGHSFDKNKRIMLTSGGGRPVRMEIDEWVDAVESWITVAHYHPKYCPECGRKLDEYKQDKE